MRNAVYFGLGAVFVAIFVLFGYAASIPPEFVVEESITIPSDNNRIWPNISIIQHWESWSPWKKRDPSVISTYSGPSEGVGATMGWTSKNSGNGILRFVDVIENQIIRYELEFKDWKTMNRGEIRLASISERETSVTWVMSGTRKFSDRIFWIVFCIDSSIHKDFQGGLEALKAISTY